MKTDLLPFNEIDTPGSISPSGRYSLAWGVPGVTDLQRRYDNPDFDPDAARNYVVERRSLAVLGVLPLHERHTRWYGQKAAYKIGGNHFPRLNHSSLAAAWSRNEDWLVVVHDGKWRYNAIYLGHRDGGAFRFIEIGDAIEDVVRAELRCLRPRNYAAANRADGRDPYVETNTVEKNDIHLHSPL